MKLSELIKLHIVKRLPAIIGTVFLTALFFSYYVGILDVSFIERPEGWKENFTAFSQLFFPDTAANGPEEDTPVSDQGTNSPSGDTVPTPDSNKPRPEKNEAITGQVLKFSPVSALKAEGYRLTDSPYGEGYVFGILDAPYAWPEKFSYTWKSYDKEKATFYDDGTETTVENVRYSGERAALELYMGYIIYDDNGTLYIIGPDGAVLTTYDDTQYRPAYTRDREGRPLFYKEVTVTEEYPTLLGPEDENGNRPWEQTAKLKRTVKEYYYLAPDGRTFKRSDYNDSTDNRGLYFDYPSYYGTTTSNLGRYYLNTTKFVTDLEGKTSVIDDLYWAYSVDPIDLSLLRFDRDGILVNEDGTQKGDEPKTKRDLFPYTMAYNYSGGYATVFQDIDWSYDHDMEHDGIDEIKTYDVTTNELRIVDKEGKVMFESRKNWYSDLSWTAHEKFSRPLYSDIRSLGSYYFDHGLMRLRIQTWDCYYFAQFDTVKIVTDEDVLVDPKGEIFQLPSEYTMVSYSDGVILLEKDNTYGYMNYLGNWVKDPVFTDARPFLEGVAACKNAEGYWGVIDTDGNTVIPFNYTYISDISGGTIAAYSETAGWTVYQKLSK
ncbi:MAG: WG repeat-containing protein [Clostridia bacterium]|nr:WG repeat-containing protein [Clostridia bacterium]